MSIPRYDLSTEVGGNGIIVSIQRKNLGRYVEYNDYHDDLNGVTGYLSTVVYALMLKMYGPTSPEVANKVTGSPLEMKNFALHLLDQLVLTPSNPVNKVDGPPYV